MNIWIFNHYAMGLNSSGGTRHFDLAKQLVRRGHSVTIFASSFNYNTLRDDYLSESKDTYKEEVQEGVNFVWIKTTEYKSNNYKRVLNMLSYTKKVIDISKKIKMSPDIIIGSLVHPLAAWAGYKVAKKRDSIFYFEERDLWPQTLIDLGKFSAKNPIIYVLGEIELFLFKKAKKIIVLFDKAVGYVESKGISKEKVIYIPNGFDGERSSNSINLSEEMKDVFKKLEGQTIAVYTGVHGKANNLDVILDAAKEIEKKRLNTHFLLIGNGQEKERLKKRVREEKINKVTLIDSVNKEMIPAILQNADVGLLPLVDSPVFKWGISPNKLFDYMGAALPVLLLCDLEDTPVDKAQGGKVIKSDFKNEIIAFFSNMNEKELEVMGENAKEYVEQHHSWEQLALTLEKYMLEDIKNK